MPSTSRSTQRPCLKSVIFCQPTLRPAASYTPAADLVQWPWQLPGLGYTDTALALADCGFE